MGAPFVGQMGEEVTATPDKPSLLGENAHIGGAHALGFFGDFKLNFVTFAQRAVAVGLDGAVVDEYVLPATFLLNEAEASFIIEHFHCTGCHKSYSFICRISRSYQNAAMRRLCGDSTANNRGFYPLFTRNTETMTRTTRQTLFRY